MTVSAGHPYRHPPIRVGKLVRQSYLHVANDFPRLLLVCLGAAALLGAGELTIALMADWMFGPDRPAAAFTTGWGALLGIAAFGLAVFRYLLIVAIAVHWHRSILSGERSWRSVQIGAREGRYLLWLVAWVAIFIFVMILIYSTARYLGATFSITDWLGANDPLMDGRTKVLRLIVSVCVYAVLVAPFYTIALVLPARAADEKGFGFLSALRLTRGNFWRIALASLCFKPPIVLLMLLVLGIAAVDWHGGPAALDAVVGAAISIAADAATFIWICLEAGFLSFLYKALRETGRPSES